MMCTLMLTTRIMKKYKNHSPFIQKSARFSLDDKKATNYDSLPVFSLFEHTQSRGVHVTCHVITIPAF